MSKFLIILIIVLVIIFIYLLKQSKKPTGLIGKKMMKLWNNTYSSLYKNGLKQIDINTDSTLKVIDIGIGNGESTKYLAQNYSNSTILGIDYSRLAVKEAKVNNKNFIESKQVSIILGDVEELMLNKNSYDLVCAFQTHFYWNNFEKCLQNIYNILKPNGILLIACEANKLKYHLKKYDGYTKFEQLTREIGFSKINEIKDGNNIIYVITK